MDFDVTLPDFDAMREIIIPFKFKGEDYQLREATEEAATRYRNAVSQAFSVNEDGKASIIKGLADTEGVLLMGCVFEKKNSGEEPDWKPVSLQKIKSWPRKVTKPLFEKAREISLLDEQDQSSEMIEKQIVRLNKILEERGKGKDPSKNSPAATTE